MLPYLFFFAGFACALALTWTAYFLMRPLFNYERNEKGVSNKFETVSYSDGTDDVD